MPTFMSRSPGLLARAFGALIKRDSALPPHVLHHFGAPTCATHNDEAITANEGLHTHRIHRRSNGSRTDLAALSH